MRKPVVADKGGMETFHTWKCPGCGALVGIPRSAPAPNDPEAKRRLDQLAQAACGCWVDVLSELSMVRLLHALVDDYDDVPRFSPLLAGRGC
jgi:hypothetical protein